MIFICCRTFYITIIKRICCWRFVNDLTFHSKKLRINLIVSFKTFPSFLKRYFVLLPTTFSLYTFHISSYLSLVCKIANPITYIHYSISKSHHPHILHKISVHKNNVFRPDERRWIHNTFKVINLYLPFYCYTIVWG